MMDKAYIQENEILERYVLGELTDAENLQVEAALTKFPKLKTQLTTIENSFEELAFENAIMPPSDVKVDLLDALTNTESQVIEMTSDKSITSYLKIASGIAAILLIGLVYMFTQLNETNKQLQLVEEENIKLNQNIENLNNNLSESNKWFATINDPDVQKYVLTGNALMPEATVISYVNDKKKTVILNTNHLPELDDTHDYQMWADVEGEMIDMGIIDNSNDMIAMNYINNAESLNITIEPAGGNDHPTVSQLISNVYLQ